MTKEQAIEILKQVCAKFVGNLQDHQQIQEAFQVIKKELEPVKTELKGV